MPSSRYTVDPADLAVELAPRRNRPPGEDAALLSEAAALFAPAPDPVAVALDAFYAKPAKALYHAVELAAYARAGVRLAGPVLDLGCGDGTMAAMLLRAGIIDRPPACGLDIDEPSVRRALRRHAHGTVLRGDAYLLPFADGSFRAVTANTLLSALPDSPEPAVAEACRVLARGGRFAVTVPTPRQRAAAWPSGLAALLPRQAREQLVARFEARSQDHLVLEPSAWLRAFRGAGLEIVTVEPFMGPDVARACSLLALQPLRVLSTLRATPALGRRLAGRLLETPTHRLVEADAATDAATAGSVLIVAERP
jgi:SAM-dependent methyltransferase